MAVVEITRTFDVIEGRVEFTTMSGIPFEYACIFEDKSWPLKPWKRAGKDYFVLYRVEGRTSIQLSRRKCGRQSSDVEEGTDGAQIQDPAMAGVVRASLWKQRGPNEKVRAGF